MFKCWTQILQNKIRPAGQRRMNRPPVIPPWAHKAKRGRRLPFQRATSDCDQASFLQALTKNKIFWLFSLIEIDIHSQNMSTKTNFCHNICWLCWRFFPSKHSMPQAMRVDQLSCDSDQTDPQRSIFCCCFWTRFQFEIQKVIKVYQKLASKPENNFKTSWKKQQD